MIENGLKKARAAAEATLTNGTIVPANPQMIPNGNILTRKIRNGTAASASARKPPVLVATPFNWIDPRTLPRREFAYGNHLIANTSP